MIYERFLNETYCSKRGGLGPERFREHIDTGARHGALRSYLTRQERGDDRGVIETGTGRALPDVMPR
jgi:hypothetical protein